MKIEAALLTGGASTRMGTDKASMPVGGEPMAQRIAQSLAAAGLKVTVLGREPIQGYAFLQDQEEHGGPMAALSAFSPTAEFVFVISCDYPLFDPLVVEVLLSRIGDACASVAEIRGRLQPLLA